MTAFTKENIRDDGEFIYYVGGDKPKFLARFKHVKRDKRGFISFLIKNVTVEEYYADCADGEVPMRMLEAKGYVSLTIKNILKNAGFPATRQGYDDYRAARVETVYYKAPPVAAI